MTVRQQLTYWAIGALVFVLCLWLLASALMPFVLGVVIAYLTDPMARWLQRQGVGRVMATVILTVASLGAVVVALLLVMPLLVDQIRLAVERAPEFIDDVRTFIAELLPRIQTEGGYLSRALESLKANAQAWSVDLLKQLLSSGLAVINFLSVLVITPVVAFYLLMDWDRLVRAIDDLLPRPHRKTIHKLLAELDGVIAGFVRGQLTVCLILGTFYALGLLIVGLNFGLLIGVFAGLISFIPFVGAILGGILSVGVAAVQFWDDPAWIGVVAGIFIAGQTLEGYVLTPKLVGGKVGLHPVWLMFALSAFGVLFGFVGLLVAVPAAASIGVIGRFLLGQYKEGRLYQGTGEPPAGGSGPE